MVRTTKSLCAGAADPIGRRVKLADLHDNSVYLASRSRRSETSVASRSTDARAGLRPRAFELRHRFRNSSFYEGRSPLFRSDPLQTDHPGSAETA